MPRWPCRRPPGFGTRAEPVACQHAVPAHAVPAQDAVPAHAEPARASVMAARVGVITFPGSLDDKDAARAVQRAGGEAVPLWHGDRVLRGVDAVILPGGFSYGDYLRCGAIARFAPVMTELVPAARAGLPVLGICNGFQILCEAHLLPGALTRNGGLRFVSKDVRLRIESIRTPWTSQYAEGQEITVVLKSGEGAYVAGPVTLAELGTRGRVVARYAGANPNGSAGDIAGICNETGNVVGLTPQRPQPHTELGLTDAEYERIRGILGRRPTDAELAIYSVMWSEHCSYKSSKVYLRRLAAATPPVPALLAGMGHNAGVVDVGQGHAVTFKIESHNHPSYVESYEGAATGVGGIVRDVLAMGARPVAVMDALRFGPANAPDTRRVLPGVVSGISFYGNCLGLPNIGGELVFDACYAGNPLVNVLCVGVMRHEDLKLAAASGPGNKVILFGARTGPDGIGGASVLASATFRAGSGSKRPSVQVGDPFMEKLLVECSLELFGAGIVAGVQDLGAAGVSCATTELAAAGSGGMRVELDAIPLRDPSLGPAEILMSESQERMMAVTAPACVEQFMRICAKWDVPATVIGEVTGTGRLVMTWRGEVVVDIPPTTAADEGPVYERPARRPASQDALRGDDPAALPRPADGAELRETLLRLLASPDLAAKTWVTQQYDRYVRGNTVLCVPDDAGLLRIDEDTGLGVAVATDGNGRYARLDPYAGAQLAVAEACRNVAATGARPLAVTNCLNFGSPEDPGVMWQFSEAVRGLADGCQQLGIPVTGGNVSFYNQTGQTAILPTPVIGVLGIIDDVTRRTPHAFHTDGAQIYLLGDTLDEFGGSEWMSVAHGFLGGRPPAVDLERERLLADVLIDSARDGLVDSAHDLAEAGLAATLVEACLHRNVGARVVVPEGVDPFVFLFAESAGRAIITVPRGDEGRFTDMCADRGLPFARIGVVDVLSTDLEVQEQFTVSLADLRSAWSEPLPALFG